MDQVRPQMREQRCADCASLDWSTGPHPTLSGSGRAPIADRSKTPAAGVAHEGLTAKGLLQKPTKEKMWVTVRPVRCLTQLSASPSGAGKSEQQASACRFSDKSGSGSRR